MAPGSSGGNRPCELLPLGCPDKKKSRVPKPRSTPQQHTAAKKPTAQVNHLNNGMKPVKKVNAAQNIINAKHALENELAESQQAMKELQLAFDAEKLARQKVEAARRDCETARAKCQSQAPLGAFNLNTRSDLPHMRKTDAVQLGGKKKALEKMLMQERAACEFTKQLSSSCKECIYGELKDCGDRDSRLKLRSLLKKMNASPLKRITAEFAQNLMNN